MKDGNIFIGILYHGTNKKKLKLGKESCFTKSKKIARNYAAYWAEEYGGKPTIHKVNGTFKYVGGADEYKLIKLR